jgi:hypothetical protein
MSNPYLCDFQGIAITTLEVRASAIKIQPNKGSTDGVTVSLSIPYRPSPVHTPFNPKIRIDLPMHDPVPRATQPPTPQHQVCIVLWNSFMALQVYRWIILKQDTLALRRQLHPALFS